MKYKIFDICRLIYEEQREAGAQLQQIERTVEKLKVDFKEAMIKKKGYYGSYEDLDALFEYSKTNSDHRIYTEVKQKINEIKKRNIYNNLEGQLSKMKIKAEECAESNDKSIKDKLTQGSYDNPLIMTLNGHSMAPISLLDSRVKSDSKLLGKR
jgi:hypothetical protein